MLKFLFFVMTLSELAFRQTDAGTCIHYAKSLCFPQWRRRQGVETGGGRGGDRTNAKDAKFPEELRSMLPKKFSILRVFKTLFLAFSLI